MHDTLVYENIIIIAEMRRTIILSQLVCLCTTFWNLMHLNYADVLEIVLFDVFTSHIGNIVLSCHL